MGHRKEEREEEPGARAPSIRRACLIVSLILLVWNLCATCIHALSPERPAVMRKDLSVSGTQGTGTPGRSLTPRQGYLLGKRVDVNRATFDEINALPGVSDRVAHAVIEARESRGGFRSPEELLDVPGIKEKRLKKILPFLTDFHNN